jgi:predicted nucleic acid-binding protein
MTKVSKVFVDTNILIRALTTNAPLHKEADALIKQSQEQAAELWISRQVLREYIVQSTRPQTYQSALPVEQLLKHVETIETLFKIADDTAEVTARLLALLKDYSTGGKQVHDANIVATMLANDIDILLTHNVDDFRRFESVISIIPLVKEAT